MRNKGGLQKKTGTGFLLPAAFFCFIIRVSGASIPDFPIISVTVVEIPILWYAIKELCPEFT